MCTASYNARMAQTYDICIRGAGIVGRTLALLLARERMRVALVDALAPEHLQLAVARPERIAARVEPGRTVFEVSDEGPGVADAEKRVARLQTAFTESAASFRGAVAALLGWRVDMRPPPAPQHMPSALLLSIS